MDEQPRPDANADERAYALTVEEALLRYEVAGHGTDRPCSAKILRARRSRLHQGNTECGQRYRITPASVARHLEQIDQVSQAKGRDQSRTDASVRPPEMEQRVEQKDEPTVREQPRPDATDTRYVEQLEKENSYLREQNDKKDKQLERRDTQIEAMIERDRETNILIKGLQERIPQLGQGDTRSAPTRYDERGTEVRAGIAHSDVWLWATMTLWKIGRPGTSATSSKSATNFPGSSPPCGKARHQNPTRACRCDQPHPPTSKIAPVATRRRGMGTADNRAPGHAAVEVKAGSELGRPEPRH